MSGHGHDIVVLGCSKDVEALFRLLRVEAPAMLQRIIVILSRRVRVLALATDCAHGSELRRAGADEVFHITALDDLHG